MTTQTHNEAAERLLYFIKLWSSPATAKQLNSLTDEALAAERRAMVERIRARAVNNSRFDGLAFAALRAILDEEAAR